MLFILNEASIDYRRLSVWRRLILVTLLVVSLFPQKSRQELVTRPAVIRKDRLQEAGKQQGFIIVPRKNLVPQNQNPNKQLSAFHIHPFRRALRHGSRFRGRLPSETVRPLYHASPGSATAKYLIRSLPFSSRLRIVLQRLERAGLCTQPGYKSNLDPLRNEDVGNVEQLMIEWMTSGRGRHYYHRIRVEIASVFDGHGPPQLMNRNSPGRIFSETALSTYRRILQDKLLSILAAPTLPYNSINFLNSSRQSLFAQALEHTGHELAKILGGPINTLAGSTASVVMAFQSNVHSFRTPVLLMAVNLGDSRAVAYTFKKRAINPKEQLDSHYYEDFSVRLTSEENIREPVEKRKVLRNLIKNNFRLVSDPNFLETRGRAVFFPSSFTLLRKYEPFTRIDMLEDPYVAAEIQRWMKLGHPNGFQAFSLQMPYLLTYNSAGFYTGNTLQQRVKLTGLQLTNSLGDAALTPIKMTSQNPINVRLLKLLPEIDSITIVVIASDGLWDTEASDRGKHLINKLLTRKLNRYLREQKNDRVIADQISQDLVMLAQQNTRDDITVAVSEVYKMVLESMMGWFC